MHLRLPSGAPVLNPRVALAGLTAALVLASPARAEDPSVAEETAADTVGAGAPATGGASSGAAAVDAAGLPVGTRSLRLRGEVPVLADARPWGRRLGRLAADTRVAWTTVVDAPKGAPCPRWFGIVPRGFVCASDVEPSPLPPTSAVFPRTELGGLLPADFTGMGPIGARPELVDAASARTCAPAGPRPDDAGQYDVSEFAGVRLDCPDAPPLPLAWVQQRLDITAPVPVRAAPKATAPVVRTLPARALVTPGATSPDGAHTAIGPDAWVATKDLHAARVAPPPDGVGAAERWIDIDLEQQVLVAYEGATPVYATLVSSGTPTHPTPGGVFRIADKRGLAIMESVVNGAVAYRGVVPWTMYYAENFAVHAAYWHDRFGARMSHGCVNLAPLDARVLFHWSAPFVPEGWMSVKDSVETPGSVVRIHRGPVRRPGRAPAPGAPSPSSD